MAADALAPYISNDIDYVEYVSPGLTWGRILSTCVISIQSNDIKCKYMLNFPLKKIARKGLPWGDQLRHSHSCNYSCVSLAYRQTFNI